MKQWFELIFDKRTVDEFLDECHQFTEEFVSNYAKELFPSWPMTTKLPKRHFDFEPSGVVVHATESPSIWNSLHMCARHVYGTHFMVLSGRNQVITRHLKRYPLLSALPSPVLLLYPLSEHIPHSGYISSKTWSIDLRNAGRLRPYRKGLSPLPLMPAEETESNFKTTPGVAFDAYWRQNLWCYLFEGNIFQHDDRIYEIPSYHQVISLIILIRALDVYSDGLDFRTVVPSNCISSSNVKFPYFNWSTIRKLAMDRGEIPYSQDLAIYPSMNTPYEYFDLDLEDESLIGELMEVARWRGERDDGQLNVLYSDREFKLSRGYRPLFETLGYDISDPDFALRLWTLSKGLQEIKDNEIYGKLNQLITPLFLDNVHPIR